MRYWVPLFVGLVMLVAACGEPDPIASTATLDSVAGGEQVTETPEPTTPPATETATATSTSTPTQEPFSGFPPQFSGRDLEVQYSSMKAAMLGPGDLSPDTEWTSSDFEPALGPAPETCEIPSFLIERAGSETTLWAGYVASDGTAELRQSILAHFVVGRASSHLAASQDYFDALATCIDRQEGGIVAVTSYDVDVPAATDVAAYRVELAPDGASQKQIHVFIAYVQIHNVAMVLDYRGAGPIESEFDRLVEIASDRVRNALLDSIKRASASREEPTEESKHGIITLQPPGATVPPVSATVTPAATPTSTPLPSPTATFPPIGPVPELPPIPEITSCEHAAELIIERLQIYLDAIAPLPEEAIWSDSPPAGLEDLSARLNSQFEEITQQAEVLGCSEDEVNRLVAARLDQLEANGPGAEAFLDILKAAFAEAESMASPTPALPTVSPTWTITTCDDAAAVFIAQTQIFLDSTVEMTIEEWEAMAELPPALLTYAAELTQLVEDFRGIGCTDVEVEALIAARMDQLTAQGEVAEFLLEDLRVAVEEGGLFEDL